MTPTRSAFLGLKREIRPVPVSDELTVHVRAPTVTELGRLNARVRALPDGPDRDALAGALLVAFAVCEADGTAFFPEPTDDDLAFVVGLGGRPVEALAAAAFGLNKPNKDEAKN